jgi:hypothetical protein
MTRLRERMLAALLGAAAGLGAAAAAAAPVGDAWQAHVLPAFARLLGTAAFC